MATTEHFKDVLYRVEAMRTWTDPTTRVRCQRQVMTFYLDARTQGISGIEDARNIAIGILRSDAAPDDVISVEIRVVPRETIARPREHKTMKLVPYREPLPCGEMD